MTYNQKIGIAIFIQKLKEYGCLDKYIANYMRQHAVRSPLSIIGKLGKTSCLEISCLYHDLQDLRTKKTLTPYDWVKIYCYGFSRETISFSWLESTEGYDYWNSIYTELLNYMRAL